VDSCPRHVVQLGGRLGNLLFEVAFAVATSARTGLPWCTSGDLEASTRRGLEAWTGPLPEASPSEVAALTGGPSLRGKVGRALQKCLPPGGRTWVLQTKPSFEPWHLRVRGPAFWSGYWQSPRYFEGYEAAVRQALQFRVPLSPGLQSAQALARTPGSVSVHIRRGDYLTMPGFGALDPRYFLAALERLSPTGPVLVFSDDAPWCRENLNWPLAFTVVDGGRPEEDLLLMSLCQHHILSNSTFSWWGAWLGQPGRVMVPPLWFPSLNATPELSEIYLPSWEVLRP